jgi:hypothetical protein
MEAEMEERGDLDGVDLVLKLDQVVVDYAGNVEVLERAIGMLFVARHLGWKPLFLMHDPRTVRRAEKILGVNFRESYPEEGYAARKSIAWKLLNKAHSFWRTLRGDFPYTRSPELELVSAE